MNLAKVALIGFLFLVPFVIQDGYAHGIISIKDCNVANLGYNQELYREDIVSINQAARFYVEGHPNYTMGQLAGYMDNVYLNQPVELAHCLRDLRINPSSVAQLSPLAYSALTYDREQLQGYSPNFLKEIPAPQVDLAQNIQPVQQVPPVQNEIVQAQRQLSNEEPNPMQAIGKPVQNMPVEMKENQQQIPAEYVFIVIAITAVAVGIAIIFGKIAKKDYRILLEHQRGF